jgi:formylglycine-generating enzyme required for sulfatase activity
MVTSPPTKSRITIHYQQQQRSYYAEDLGNGTLLKMVEIPGGTFTMGSPNHEPDRLEREGPQHEVSLKAFFIGMYPVTQAEWQAVATLPQVNQSLDSDPSRFKGDRRPVEQVSWNDAIEFCARLSAQTGREYGLPTEAEWEYACRAGTPTPFHFGETITTDLANYNGSREKYGAYDRGPKGIYRQETTPVESFPANAWGLYDLHGNVWEWCADHWHEDYSDKPEALKAEGNLPWLSEQEETRRSLRGGSWFNVPRFCRSAFRNRLSPDDRVDSLGFRVVCRLARTL